MKLEAMTALERRAVSGLAGIFALRMLGLFLILPVFALYAQDLSGHTLVLAGLALGIYGLSQALLQIPLGWLSDRLGRKPVIVAGLLVFALGSVIAALSTSIYGVILGRALQGAGAIAAAVLALAADLTRDSQRTKAMAIIGMTIGASFILSMLLGPLLQGVIGVNGIFWLTAVLALGGIAVLLWWVPRPLLVASPVASKFSTQLTQALRDKGLLRLDIGIFVLHACLTAMFVVVPLLLVQRAGLDVSAHWRVYVPVMLFSVLGLLPLLYLAERRGHMRVVFIASIALLIAAQVELYASQGTLMGVVLGLTLFFWGFNFLEAALPSMVSRLAPAASRGTAIGVYNSFEFIGAFVGGLVGAWLYQAYGAMGIFGFTGAMLLVWLLLALGMPNVTRLATRTLNVGPQPPAQAQRMAQRLVAVPGVAEAVVEADEGVIYLKVDTRVLDEKALEQAHAQ